MISVLLVDDEPAFLAIGKQFLEGSGDISVTTAESGEEGLSNLTMRYFDAVISDYPMKGMDGIALLEEARKLHPGIPFIIFTGHGREETAILAINHGADYYLQKGENPGGQFAELERRIREAVQEKFARDEAARVNEEELTKSRRSLEELRAAYQQLNATYAALRDNFRALTEQHAALRSNEEKFRHLFEDGLYAVFLVDTGSGQILDANTAAINLYGWNREELLAKTLGNLKVQESAGTFPGNEPDCLDSGSIPLSYHIRKDGTIFPVEIVERRFTLQNRTVSTVAVRDITELRKDANAQAERAARKGKYYEALVHLAITDAPTLRIALQQVTETVAATLGADRAGIWFFSADGESLLCNDVFLQSGHVHVQKPAIAKIDHETYFSLVQQQRVIVAEGSHEEVVSGKPATTGSKNPNGDATLDAPIRSGKTVIGILSVEQAGSRNWAVEDQDFAVAVADYTAILLEQARRRLADKDCRKSERKYRAVVDRANDGIAIIQKGLFRFVNPKAAEIFGLPEEELLGTPFISRVVRSDQGRIQEQYDHRMAGEEISPVFDTVFVRKDGSLVDVELNAGTIEFDGILSDLIFIRDITDRKRSEKALFLANQKLNLLSSITRHDILNKLTVAIGYLELARMTHEREKLEDFMGKIDETLEIIEGQVQFSRDYQDMGVREPEWQDGAKVFDTILSQLDPGSVRIENRLQGLMIFADPLLEKVLYNIVDNALRYGGTLTGITASFEVRVQDAVLTIEDNGAGIPVKDKEHIFEKGFGRHTGLGLFLAKEILALTGIEIMETGFPGKGARFEIHLPEGRFKIRE